MLAAPEKKYHSPLAGAYEGLDLHNHSPHPPNPCSSVNRSRLKLRHVHEASAAVYSLAIPVE